MNWKESILGWTPALYGRQSQAERQGQKRKTKGMPVALTKEGKVVTKKVPIRVRPVAVKVASTGPFGMRTFDLKPIKGAPPQRL